MHITPEAEALRSQIDAVILDMDGVLLDISQSIRRVNCLAVPFYLRTHMGWPAPDDLLTSTDIELFKNAGGFNDDWDLTYALVLHYLTKGHENPDAAPETLNVIQPKLARYAARIKERGGWLRSAEAVCLEKMTTEDRIAIESHYRKDIIRQGYEELYAGERCQELYGHPATLYDGPGYFHHDRPLLDTSRLPADKIIGVQTGRTYEEARLGLELCGLTDAIGEHALVTKRDGFHKPEPGGLRLLAERLGFSCALYIGDTLDDLRTVQNFNASLTPPELGGRGQASRLTVLPQSGEQHFLTPPELGAGGPSATPPYEGGGKGEVLGGPARFLSAQVLTGPAGAANEKLFTRSGADIVASDVHAVLEWLAA